jgi:hypothetical protein
MSVPNAVRDSSLIPPMRNWCTLNLESTLARFINHPRDPVRGKGATTADLSGKIKLADSGIAPQLPLGRVPKLPVTDGLEKTCAGLKALHFAESLLIFGLVTTVTFVGTAQACVANDRKALVAE